jgi:hypothetical protein
MLIVLEKEFLSENAALIRKNRWGAKRESAWSMSGENRGLIIR